MKLIDVEFEKMDGAVDEAPKNIKVVFLFEISPNHIHRIPMWFTTKNNTHKEVIQHLHNFIYEVVNELK